MRLHFVLVLLLFCSVNALAQCDEAVVFSHHDDAFESGYTWYGMGQQPPDHGSFAEGYNAVGTVCGMVVHLTCVGGMSIARPDAYVWASDGLHPSGVLAMVPTVQLGGVGVWPHVSRHEITIEAAVSGDFFVGIWPGCRDTGYFIAADLHGNTGIPRTKVPPGHPWPAGWHDVDEIWGDGAVALGTEARVLLEPTAGREVTPLSRGQLEHFVSRT